MNVAAPVRPPERGPAAYPREPNCAFCGFCSTPLGANGIGTQTGIMTPRASRRWVTNRPSATTGAQGAEKMSWNGCKVLTYTPRLRRRYTSPHDLTTSRPRVPQT